MSVFAYQAIDTRRRRQSGSLTADTAALARQTLRDRGLAVCRLEPLRSAPVRVRPRIWSALRVRPGRCAAQIAELWRNLSVLLEAGVPLTEALEVCRRQQAGRLQGIVRQLHESVRSGQAFADGLAAHPAWFDELTLAVVRVGQQSGSLSTALSELAEFQSRRRAIVNRLTTALIYPVILCLVGAAVVVFLMSHVVPQLLEVLQSAGRDLPFITRLLKSISDGLVGNAVFLAPAAVAAVAAVVLARRTPRGRRFFERLALQTPVLGDLLRKAWVARISLMLAALLRSAVRFTDAVRIIRKGLPHRLFADELEKLEIAVEAGSDIAEPLRDSRLMPPLVVHLLAVGQESGELPQMLEQLRVGYENEVNVALDRFLAVLEPALILVLAAAIGFVVFATLLPILETTRIVQ